MVELRSPKPWVVGSNPTAPERLLKKKERSMKVIQFFKECVAELKKVVWPSREDVVSSVKVVIVSTVIVALVLGLIDFILSRGMLIIF